MEQQRLFDPGERSTALSVRQFMDRATWHATTRGDWPDPAREKGLPVHHGTAQAAADRVRLGSAAPWSQENALTRFYPVVADEVSEFPPVNDDTANTAVEHYRGIGAAKRSNDAFVLLTARQLREGRTVPYINEAEDPGTESYVSPPEGFRLLEETTNYHDLPAGRRGNFITGTDVLRQGVRNRGNRFDTYRQPPLTDQWEAY